MSLQLSDTVRNAQLDAIETAIGTGAILKIYDLTGAAPANCAAAITATLIATITCPTDWMNAASGASKTKLGTWSVAAAGAGIADFFRLFASDGTTCHAQGTVTATGGGGDMTVDNTNIASGQTVTVNTFTLNRANG